MGNVRYQLNKDNQVDEIHTMAVHKIHMGDVEDPDLMVAQPIWEWQQSPQGQFVMDNAMIVPKWERVQNPMYMGWTYVIIAELEAKKLTEYYLKFGKFIK